MAWVVPWVAVPRLMGLLRDKAGRAVVLGMVQLVLQRIVSKSEVGFGRPAILCEPFVAAVVVSVDDGLTGAVRQAQRQRRSVRSSQAVVLTSVMCGRRYS